MIERTTWRGFLRRKGQRDPMARVLLTTHNARTPYLMRLQIRTDARLRRIDAESAALRMDALDSLMREWLDTRPVADNVDPRDWASVNRDGGRKRIAHLESGLGTAGDREARMEGAAV
jgi:hypothetical protein